MISILPILTHSPHKKSPILPFQNQIISPKTYRLQLGIQTNHLWRVSKWFALFCLQTKQIIKNQVFMCSRKHTFTFCLFSPYLFSLPTAQKASLRFPFLSPSPPLILFLLLLFNIPSVFFIPPLLFFLLFSFSSSFSFTSFFSSSYFSSSFSFHAAASCPLAAMFCLLKNTNL